MNKNKPGPNEAISHCVINCAKWGKNKKNPENAHSRGICKQALGTDKQGWKKKKKKIKITQPQITNCKAEFFNYLKEEKTGKMWKTKDTKIAIVLPTFEQTASWLSFECQRT